MTDGIPAGSPQPTGEDAPEGFTRNYVYVFKGYFCRFVCEKEWDDFYQHNVLMNEELRKNARAIFNEESEEEFHNALYNSDSDYARLVRYVLDSLVKLQLFRRNQEGGSSVYWRTTKLKELCPETLKVQIPSIDRLVEEYDKRHQGSRGS
jgi:hypothetical protein